MTDDLKQRIEDELTAMGQLVTVAQAKLTKLMQGSAQGPKQGPAQVAINGLANDVYRFTTSCARIFEMVTRQWPEPVGTKVARGEELLSQLSNAYPGRPALIDHALAMALQPYFAFRRGFRDAYAIDWEKLQLLVLQLAELHTQLREQIWVHLENIPLDKAQLLTLYTQDQRQNITYPDARREALPGLVRHVARDKGGEGTVLFSQFNAEEADARIDAQIAYFAGIGQDFEWKVFDYDTPPDLATRLAKRGFELEEVEAIMVLDLVNAPAKLFQPVAHMIRKITTHEELAVLIELEEEIWGEDFGGLAHYLEGILSDNPQCMSIYLAYVEDRPVSAAWIYFPDGSQFASLWGGSTLAQYRHQGLYTALLAIRTQEARTRQVRFLTVDASPLSRPILEKFGFVKLAESTPCKWRNPQLREPET